MNMTINQNRYSQNPYHQTENNPNKPSSTSKLCNGSVNVNHMTHSTHQPSSISTYRWHASTGFRESGGWNRSISQTERMEILARTYMELREKIKEYYTGDEFYRKMDKLNRSFESFLKHSLPITATSDHIPGSLATKFKNNKIENFQRHMSNFFEHFINNIQNMDFDEAFQASMDVILNSETTSLTDISFLDVISMNDWMEKGVELWKTDEFPKEFRYNIFSWTIKMILNDQKLPELLRIAIANMFGLVLGEVTDMDLLSI